MSSAIKAGWYQMFYRISKNTPLRKRPDLPFSAVGWISHQPQCCRDRGVFAEREQ